MKLMTGIQRRVLLKIDIVQLVVCTGISNRNICVVSLVYRHTAIADKTLKCSDLSEMLFREVIPQEKLVWHHSSTDTGWNVISNPMMADWPRVVLTTVTFEEMGSKTRLRLVCSPFEATEAGIACFAGAIDRFGKGWQSGYAIIDEMLNSVSCGNLRKAEGDLRNAADSALKPHRVQKHVHWLPEHLDFMQLLARSDGRDSCMDNSR